MPIALIKIIEGRSPEEKRQLIESVSQAMADNLAMPLDAVRVLLHEYPAGHWGRASRLVSDIPDKSSSAPSGAQLAYATAKLLAN